VRHLRLAFLPRADFAFFRRDALQHRSSRAGRRPRRAVQAHRPLGWIVDVPRPAESVGEGDEAALPFEGVGRAAGEIGRALSSLGSLDTRGARRTCADPSPRAEIQNSHRRSSSKETHGLPRRVSLLHHPIIANVPGRVLTLRTCFQGGLERDNEGPRFILGVTRRVV
jgi:hypothetical protein